ncbi:hypothetical protein DUI87_00038 [Hirundo rustica rustica]|uniref:Ion transport domain-containing protein n=1 Tax=Hirundo rustica rustica TaxID=333673 RepID=A0A3M0LCP8_HIRRU|nr:hypothetical protein DUI87_00038 [Hirundo rustica rustica]
MAEQNYLSRNFYNLRFLALFLAFAINFILLFYKVSEHPPGSPEEPEGSGALPEEAEGVPGGSEAALPEEPEVYYFLEESTGYMGPALRALALAHTLVAFLCIIGYNCLKVTPALTPSFPSNYWDKFIKRKSFLYLTWYMAMSLLGHYNNFFFASHLLDIAMGVRRCAPSCPPSTHNGKQLVMTVGLLAVVVYLYTVVAFNFFRKFYNKSEDEDEPDMNVTCSTCTGGSGPGGGIGDEIEDPAGDDYELYRVVFDITFFFFVIVILLAIIQGLIIDAFGELRDQQEQGEGGHGDEMFHLRHRERLFRHDAPRLRDPHAGGAQPGQLQFFLMYLINKDETEHTGQESYVWKMYQERCWDFFPAGDCFRKQYEDQLG